jgi:hypothetical protein
MVLLRRLSRGFIVASITKVGRAILGFTIWFGIAWPFSFLEAAT